MINKMQGQETTHKKYLQKIQFSELRMLHRFSVNINDTLIYMRLPLQKMFYMKVRPFNAIAISEWFDVLDRCILIPDDYVVVYVGPYDG